MKAYHITSKANYEAILRDGFIRPRSQPRQWGEQGGGFSIDWHAEDNQYVFFAPSEASEFYLTLTDGTDAYGFVYDAEFLVLKMNGLVGPDLMTRYDDLMHQCAQEIANSINPKPIDEEGLKAFIERHQISDPRMIENIRKEEASYYLDILNGMLDSDESVQGVKEGLNLFKEKVREIQTDFRMEGENGLMLLRAIPMWELKPYEILVPGPVPVDACLHHIIAGEEDIRC